MNPLVRRAEFPVFNRHIDGLPITYLDSAATTLKPFSVIDAMVRYYSTVGANIHRGKHRLSEEASTAYEDARARVAEFVGAATSEIVFVRNTTEGLGVVCQGLGLSHDDLVVIGTEAHHSNMLPWRHRARTAFVRTDQAGRPDLDHYADLLTLRPCVVALNHCSNVTGAYAPLAEMAAMAKQVDACVVADMAQSVPHRRANLKALGVDFAAFSSHKLLGPTGIGVLYGRESRLRSLEPLTLGGGTVDWVDSDHYVVRDVPHRLEAGTPHIAGAYGLQAAVDYLDGVGLDAVARHGEALGAALLSALREVPRVRIVGDIPGVDRTSIVSFSIDGVENLDDIARSLSDSYGVMCRSGHMCAQPFVLAEAGAQVLRASGYIYNGLADVETLVNALRELVDLYARRAPE